MTLAKLGTLGKLGTLATTLGKLAKLGTLANLGTLAKLGNRLPEGKTNNTRDFSVSWDVADMILIKQNKNEVVLLKKREMYVKPSPLRPSLTSPPSCLSCPHLAA